MSVALIWWVNVEHFCSSSRAVFSLPFNQKLHYEKVFSKVLWGEETNFSLKSPWWGFYVVINFDLISKINVFRKFSYKEKYWKSVSPRLIPRWVIRLHFYATVPVFSFRNLFPDSQKIFTFQRLTWLSKVLQKSCDVNIFVLEFLRCILVHACN